MVADDYTAQLRAGDLPYIKHGLHQPANHGGADQVRREWRISPNRPGRVPTNATPRVVVSTTYMQSRAGFTLARFLHQSG
jgi:hypothetical protein